MIRTDISRKEFLSGGLAAFGSLFGLPAFAVAKGWRPKKKPNLVFGVLSDTHMRVDYNKVGFWRIHADEAFRQALRYFKRNDVDAVMHCGDWADRGSYKAMEFHSRAWYDIFPNGMNNGKKIEKLFVIGNHDVCVGDGEYISWVYGDDWPRHALKYNLHRWPKLWREEYRPAWHKTVKGYHFFGYDVDLDREKSQRHAQEMVRLLEEEAAKGNLKGPRPFFTAAHWCPDPRVCEVAGRLGNGIGFYGHGHYNLAYGDLFGWEGTSRPRFLNIKAGGMKCAHNHLGQRPPFAQGFGDGSAAGHGGLSVRHGYLVKVYDDCLVLRRVDFERQEAKSNRMPNGKVLVDHHCAPLGPDWVLPFGDYTEESHPFSKASLLADIGEPQFRRGARLTVRFEEGAVVLSIPKADGNLKTLADGGVAGTRVYGYHVEITGPGGTNPYRSSVYANGCSFGVGHEPDGGVTEFRISRADMPHGGRCLVKVWPCSSLGTKGKPISVRFNA